LPKTKMTPEPPRIRSPDFTQVIGAFARDRAVSAGGAGFGANALKIRGKIFAMSTSRGELVVKLPKSRVDELVGLGVGERFDPGHGRRMKEWVVFWGSTAAAIALAREARVFVGAPKR
jgi:hypothetical protein